MQLHELQPITRRMSAKRIGRGGKRGKTSGRGGKGQTARAGGGPRPEMRDTIKRLPKRRGFGKNRARTVNAERARLTPVNVSAIESTFDDGAAVNPKTIVNAKLLGSRGARLPKVKILGTGALSKKLIVSGCAVSASARKKIEAAGGTIAV